MTGISASFNISWDDNGNIGYQFSFSGIGDNVGLADVGAVASFGTSIADTISDLEGPSVAVGASGGYFGYAGIDAIYFGDLASQEGLSLPDGVQLSIGCGIGADIHIVQDYTDQTIPLNRSQKQKNAKIKPRPKLNIAASSKARHKGLCY